jgi:glycosyltransferase involved in cell wall biosynthesis
MKILVVSGMTRSLINFRGRLLKEMVGAGHEVLAASGGGSDDVIAELHEMGVRFCPLALSRAGLNPWADLKTLFALRRLIRVEKPECVLAYTAKPVIYGNLAARGLPGTRVYSMITGLGYAFGAYNLLQRLTGILVQALYRAALNKTSGVFFQNPDDRDEFLDRGLLALDAPIKLINGSGVDLDWYAPQPLPKKQNFLLIARLLADKGLREYVAAARTLKKRYPQAQFRIAGNIDSNPLSISAAELEAWQAEGVIEYLGRLSDVRLALADTRVYVLPSYREGTPRTVLEAMAMGRPVITTDAPGCRETVIDGENGFLVPAKDTEALASAMERFIHDPDLAKHMGNASLQIARDKYDVHKVNADIMRGMGL